MRGEKAQEAQRVEERRRPVPRSGRGGPRLAQRRPQSGRSAVGRLTELREARKTEHDAGVYRRRQLMAISLLILGALALVFAVLVQTQASGATERAVPIDPNNAGPDTVLAEAAGVGISTPVRPANLTGLGYHPEGGSLVAMAPRGENRSKNALLGLVSNGETPEDINYNIMDDAGRDGPGTGALDVGAGSGSTAYAPVTGSVTSIRPDPTVEGANIVEIKPDANPDVRVNVALVQSDGGAGVNDRVVAGMTRLGAVADSAKVLDPQLSTYTADSGNHVTVTVSRVG
ncbi:MAG: hypothetical protein H0V28_00090 [Rubrobacteraceae bacterium]|nr:hypothetical protein [Rubrobacteraceae bacterium]